MTRPSTEPLVLDLTLPPGSAFDAELPAGHNAFVYVFGGVAVHVGEGETRRSRPSAWRSCATMPASDGVRLAVPAGASGPARVLLVAGRPLQRADRAVRPVRDEHDGRDPPGVRRLPARRARGLSRAPSGAGGMVRSAIRPRRHAPHDPRRSPPAPGDPRHGRQPERRHRPQRPGGGELEPGAGGRHGRQPGRPQGAPGARPRRRRLPLPRVRQLLQPMAAAQRAEDVDRLADLSDGVRQGHAGRRRPASSPG